MSDHEKDGLTRRRFVTTAAVAGAGLTIVPRHVLGHGFQAPSDTVNVATVGIGGMGRSNTIALMSQNIVAFCDVDDRLVEVSIQRMQKEAAAAPPPASGASPRPLSKAQQAANARRPRVDRRAGLQRFVAEQLPKVKKYRDYREMLDKQQDIDGIVVATPDHMHAAVATAAMDLGKHVYVQKPLCWSVEEARVLARKARDNKKVVTQMGNQGHSSDGARTGYEYIRAGAIGDVSEVHVFTNRPLGYWPQGIPRPAPMPPEAQPAVAVTQPWNARLVERKLAAAMHGSYPVPGTLSWDLFIGVAPMVEYHPLYHPHHWRGWVDWGQGALGDMGAHLVDHPFWALDLGYPTVIETVSTPFNGVSFPHATKTYYEFPARGSMPPVKLTWYDGGLTPPHPEELGEERFNPEGAILYIGSKGKMLQHTYGHDPRLLPKSLHDSVGEPKPLLPRITHGEAEHELNWIEAIKGKAEISSPFEYAGPLTEVMLLGIVALRAGGKIHYDGANMRVTNTIKGPGGRVTDPNQFLKRDYRAGWKLT